MYVIERERERGGGGGGREGGNTYVSEFNEYSMSSLCLSVYREDSFSLTRSPE